MQRSPIKVYVVMSTSDIKNNVKPVRVYTSAEEARRAYQAAHQFDAILFDRIKLVEAQCSDKVRMTEFKILKQHDYLEAMPSAAPASPQPLRPQRNEQNRGVGLAVLMCELGVARREVKDVAPSPSPSLSPLEKLAKFLNLDIRKLTNDQKPFLYVLAKMLPDNFFEFDKRDQFKFIYESRENTQFMNLLMSHWPLAVRFIDTVIGDDQALRAQLNTSQRLSMIFNLNNLRRDIIPEDIRRRMPLEQQQQHVMRVLQHHHEKKQRPKAECAKKFGEPQPSPSPSAPRPKSPKQ